MFSFRAARCAPPQVFFRDAAAQAAPARSDFRCKIDVSFDARARRRFCRNAALPLPYAHAAAAYCAHAARFRRRDAAIYAATPRLRPQATEAAPRRRAAAARFRAVARAAARCAAAATVQRALLCVRQMPPRRSTKVPSPSQPDPLCAAAILFIDTFPPEFSSHQPSFTAFSSRFFTVSQH